MSIMTDADLEMLLHVPSHSSVQSVIEQVELAESLDYQRVSMGETTGWNRVALLALLADRTTSIGLANDVFSPYSRSPALLVQTATVIDSISQGRYRLGLGASSPNLVEGWHGVAYDRPLRRLRETIDIVREAVGGQPVHYDGEIFDLSGLSTDREPSSGGIPIDVAALGPKAVELTGRFADGWVPQMYTPSELKRRSQDVRQGAALGNQDIDSIRTSFVLRCCAMDDGEQARKLARRHLGFVIGAYGPFYRKSIARQGYNDVAEKTRAAWIDGDREAVTAAIPRDLVDKLVAVGRPDEVREKYREFATIKGVDAVRVGFLLDQPLANQERTMNVVAEG